MEGVLIYIILIAIVVYRFTKTGRNGKGAAGRDGAAGRPGSAAGSAKSEYSDPFDTGRAAAGTRGARGFRRAVTSGKGPFASDGHRVPADQDISCRRFGHQHEEFDTPRYIPHTDPEDGYIVLNGVMMKLSEADRYEDRI